MFIPQTYSLAIVLCIVTMLCWGSWGNTQKLAGKSWRFELFYWDYVLGILLFALLIGFTLGSTGENGRGFIDDIGQAKGGNILNALLGGVIFNASNILLVAAMAIAGMAVAFPVGVGIALALGVIINYIAVPKGNPLILFIGVGFYSCGNYNRCCCLQKTQYHIKASFKERYTAFGFSRYPYGTFLPFRGKLYGY